MFLTQFEFNNKIRKFKWHIKEIGNKNYYTLHGETDTHLFWYDFMKNIFAEKFKNQQAITNISVFDITQPVFITKDFELLLPSELETINYFSQNNKSSPFDKFILNISHLTIIILILLSFAVIFFRKYNMHVKMRDNEYN